jgi:pimeloyl-ACP methyl ester carboxylesterase
MSFGRICALVLAGSLAVPLGAGNATPAPMSVLQITYRAHDGKPRHATVLVPAWARQGEATLPLVISPHGRGITGSANARLWGNLPAAGGFVVVNPDGEGSHVDGRFSWGASGEIDDLARMPQIVREALPWLRIDRRRLYAVGGSMGGQETLLLLARHPDLLAGAVAVDPLVDFSRQYRNFRRLACDLRCRRGWHGPVGIVLQALARREVGGTPESAPAAYAARSPITYARTIAGSCTPLQLWWSRTDQIVVDSPLQSGALARRLRHVGTRAPFEELSGTWRHTSILRWTSELPAMLTGLGLLASRDVPFPSYLHVHARSERALASAAPCGG